MNKTLMQELLLILAVGLGLAAGRIYGAGGDGQSFYSPEELEKIGALSPIPNPPPDKSNAYADNEKAAKLGQSLFFDKRLSGAGNVSCATCHDPAHGWQDGLALPKLFMDPHSPAHRDGFGARKVPSLWNLAYNHWFFWDGRADSLWGQALGPFENPKEMQGGSRLQHAHVVYGDPALKGQYEDLFGKFPDLSDSRRFPPKGCPVPDDPNSDTNKAWQSMAPADQEAVNRVYSNLGKSIEAFERKIVSHDSRFDRFVEGLKTSDAQKQSLLDDHEKNGLRLFIGKARCASCHTGPNFTDGAFHDLRVPEKTPDAGRFDGIAKVKDSLFNTAGPFSNDPKGGQERLEHLKAKPINQGQMKTTGLRNIALTGPYMHQGQMASLKDVVEYYSTLKGARPLQGPDEGLLVATHLSGQEIDDLVAFLGTLTDESADASLVPATELSRK